MKIKYGVISGTRSGSTYLCDLLESTNRAGIPKEFLNPDKREFFKDKYDYKNDRSLINHIIGKVQTDNEVFGGKFIVNVSNPDRNQLQHLIDQGYNDLSDWKWVILLRDNIVLQAISRYRAYEDNMWTYSGNVEIPEVEYNYDRIQACIREIKSEREYIENFHKKIPKNKKMFVSYEQDLIPYPEQTITSILSFLDVGIENIPKLQSNSIIKRDNKSLEWEKKYRLTKK